MNEIRPRRRPEYVRRMKRKRLIIAYLMRAVVLLMLIVMMVLMVCGCLYLHEKYVNPEKPVTQDGEVEGKKLDEEEAPGGDDLDTVISAEGSAPEFCVVIDAGHGGNDGGTVSGQATEKEINLSVALQLKTILEKNNMEVILTRSEDETLSLSRRVSVANESNADFFISLHCNYFEDDAQVSGLECYYNSPDATESKAYAESIIRATSMSDDVSSREAKIGNYYVLRNTKMPAVLVEMGFLSNASERQKLQSKDYQEVLAQEIAEGILDILKDG